MNYNLSYLILFQSKQLYFKFSKKNASLTMPLKQKIQTKAKPKMTQKCYSDHFWIVFPILTNIMVPVDLLDQAFSPPPPVVPGDFFAVVSSTGEGGPSVLRLTLKTEEPIKLLNRKMTIKMLVIVISNDPPCKESNTRFTAVPLKQLTVKQRGVQNISKPTCIHLKRNRSLCIV